MRWPVSHPRPTARVGSRRHRGTLSSDRRPAPRRRCQHARLGGGGAPVGLTPSNAPSTATPGASTGRDPSHRRAGLGMASRRPRELAAGWDAAADAVRANAVDAPADWRGRAADAASVRMRSMVDEADAVVGTLVTAAAAPRAGCDRIAAARAEVLARVAEASALGSLPGVSPITPRSARRSTGLATRMPTPRAPSTPRLTWRPNGRR